jgi:hypothetical protein
MACRAETNASINLDGALGTSIQVPGPEAWRRRSTVSLFYYDVRRGLHLIAFDRRIIWQQAFEGDGVAGGSISVRHACGLAHVIWYELAPLLAAKFIRFGYGISLCFVASATNWSVSFGNGVSIRTSRQYACAGCATAQSCA